MEFRTRTLTYYIGVGNQSYSVGISDYEKLTHFFI